MTASAHSINRLLPQTQCRECGYDGCLPYAEALAQGDAAVNLCAPGGETVMLDIAHLLGQPPQPPAKTQAKALAWIDETVCIGCTACIRACPVDAIMGAHKLMHTVIRNECTGCGLCVAPCPVDCIHMQPLESDFLPLSRHLSSEPQARFAAAEHARLRYEAHQTRIARDAAERKALLAEREAATKAKLAAGKPAAFNPMDLIAQAMAKAQNQQQQLVATANPTDFKNKQIKEARERAVLRRAQRDIKYGNDEEKAAALIYLRRYKAEQEAAKAARKKAKAKPPKPNAAR